MPLPYPVIHYDNSLSISFLAYLLDHRSPLSCMCCYCSCKSGISSHPSCQSLCQCPSPLQGHQQPRQHCSWEAIVQATQASQQLLLLLLLLLVLLLLLLLLPLVLVLHFCHLPCSSGWRPSALLLCSSHSWERWEAASQLLQVNERLLPSTV